jgi:hypothetical protein
MDMTGWNDLRFAVKAGQALSKMASVRCVPIKPTVPELSFSGEMSRESKTWCRQVQNITNSSIRHPPNIAHFNYRQVFFVYFGIWTPWHFDPSSEYAQ